DPGVRDHRPVFRGAGPGHHWLPGLRTLVPASAARQSAATLAGYPAHADGLPVHHTGAAGRVAGTHVSRVAEQAGLPRRRGPFRTRGVRRRMKAEPVRVLRQLEKQLLQPEVRRSPSVLGALLADEFVEFGSSGRIFTKQMTIRALRDEPATRRSLRDFKTTVLAPAVVLSTYRV